MALLFKLTSVLISNLFLCAVGSEGLPKVSQQLGPQSGSGIWNLFVANGRACVSGLPSNSPVHFLQTHTTRSWIPSLGGERGSASRSWKLHPLHSVVFASLGPSPFWVFLGIGLSVSTEGRKTHAWVWVWAGINFSPKSQNLRM